MPILYPIDSQTAALCCGESGAYPVRSFGEGIGRRGSCRLPAASPPLILSRVGEGCGWLTARVGVPGPRSLAT